MPYIPRILSNRERECLINDYRVDIGITFKSLCKKANTDPNTVYDLIYGVASPINLTTSRIREPVVRLMKALNASFEDLFPRYSCSLKSGELLPLQKFYLLHADINTDQHKLLEEKELFGIVYKILKKNIVGYERSYIVLVKRFIENMTLEEISYDLNISRERVRQIETKAIRAIRHMI